MTSPPSKRDKDRKGSLPSEREAFLAWAQAIAKNLIHADPGCERPVMAFTRQLIETLEKGKAEREARQTEKENVESVWTESGKAE